MKRFLVDLFLVLLLVAAGSSFMEQNREIPIEQEIIDFEKQLEEKEPYVDENRGQAVTEVHINKASALAKTSSDVIEQIVGIGVELVASIFKAIVE